MRDASFNIWQVQRLFPFSKPFSFWVPEWGIKSNLLRRSLNYRCLICLLLRWLVLWRTDNLRNLLLRILFLNLSWLIFYFLFYTIIILLFPALLIRFRILSITASFKLWLIFGIWIRNFSRWSCRLINNFFCLIFLFILLLFLFGISSVFLGHFFCSWLVIWFLFQLYFILFFTSFFLMLLNLWFNSLRYNIFFLFFFNFFLFDCSILLFNLSFADLFCWLCSLCFLNDFLICLTFWKEWGHDVIFLRRWFYFFLLLFFILFSFSFMLLIDLLSHSLFYSLLFALSKINFWFSRLRNFIQFFCLFLLWNHLLLRNLSDNTNLLEVSIKVLKHCLISH